MINEFLKQIINLDQRIDRERNQIDEAVAKIEQEKIEEIQEIEFKELNSFKKECKENYDKELEKAQIFRDESVEDSQKRCEALKARYESIRFKLADEIAQKIILENT